MRNSILLLVIFSLLQIQAMAHPQKKRNTKTKTATTTAPTTPPVPVKVRYANGSEIYGKLLDINMKTATIDAGDGKVYTTTLQDIVALSIGVTAPKFDAQFLSDANEVLRLLGALSTATDNNISYTEYQPKVADMKGKVEAFLAKYQGKGPEDVLRPIRLSMRSFEMVIPVWSLRFGVEQHKYAIENSEQMKPIIDTFPTIREVEWRQNDRYPVEKVIAWVWVQAAALANKSKNQLASLK